MLNEKNLKEKHIKIFKKSNKFQIIHLQTYNCKVYMMTKNTQLKWNHKWKLNSWIYINYIINYNFINIFYKNVIIFTCDVIFDEQIFFNEKSEDLFSQMIAEINNLVVKIQLFEIQIMNENLLKEDEKVLKSFYNNEESDDEAVENFNEKKNFELTQTLEKALKLLTSSFSEFTLYV